MPNFSVVSGEIREQFRTLSSAVNVIQGDQAQQASMSSTITMFPLVGFWPIDNLGDSGVPSTEAVASLISTIEPLLAPVEEDITRRVATLLRTALSSITFVGLLHQLPLELLDMAAEGGSGDGVASFVMHRGVECDGCRKSPIVGSRFQCTTRSNYDLCKACMSVSSIVKTGLTFRESKFVWSASLDHAMVPLAPLSDGDSGPKVAFLQKVLRILDT